MFTTVAHFTDSMEAHLARGLLQAEGIDAHLGDEHLALANWEWRLAIGGIKLRVVDAQADRARTVLRALEAGEYALEEDEPAVAEVETPDRESLSSRIAWLGLMLFGIPLPWRRRDTDDDKVRRV